MGDDLFYTNLRIIRYMKKKVANSLLEKIKPSDFMDYKNYLLALYQMQKTLNADYTYHKFSEDLGFTATNVVSHIIQGRRPLTEKAARTVAGALHLTGLEKRYFLTLVTYVNAHDISDQKRHFDTLFELREQTVVSSITKENMQYFSQWFYSIIGEMARLKEFKADPEWISKNLLPDLRPKQIENALLVLEKLGILRFDEKLNKYCRTELDLSTPKEAKGLATTSYHMQMLDQGRSALSRVPANQRNFSSVTVAVPESMIKKMTDLIYQLQMDILNLEKEAKGQGANAIYQVNVQMFPFTKPLKN